jgi:Tfp pilus assembly protein PilF
MLRLPAVRALMAAIVLSGCLIAIWNVRQMWLSRSLAAAAIASGEAALAEQAISLNPANPEAHYARGIALLRTGKLMEAIQEFEQAVTLRPQDYALCLELARARQRQGDARGAIAAFLQAVNLAPYLAQPRWELGNFLLNNKYDEPAFAQLRQAAASDPLLLQSLIALAWRGYRGNPATLEWAIQPHTTEAHLELAHFLIKHGEVAYAMRLFRAAGALSSNQRYALLAALLTAKQFREAYEVWATGIEAKGMIDRGRIGRITNQSFEDRIGDGPGFDWQIERDLDTVRAFVELSNPHTGTRSLGFDWSSDSNSSTQLISQLVLVEPKARYRLSFAARTQQLVTAGLPVILVIDAHGKGQVLAQSPPMPSGTSEWQDYSLEFATGEAIEAVHLSLRREQCSGEPCPIIGRLWLDSFSLQKL